jgi:hypothetical protein
MNCEFFRSEIYAWRPDQDTGDFEPLFRHLDSCAECARLFERIPSRDEQVGRTFGRLPEAPLLESRILAGLAHERAQLRRPKSRWKAWMLMPIAALALLVLTMPFLPVVQEYRLGHSAAVLLSSPPEPQIVSTDRAELMSWSDKVLPGTASLPQLLSRVQFRGATLVDVAHHKGVLLKMKNEDRASLLVFDHPVTPQSGFRSINEKAGSVALWSDPQRTYVLLFRGSVEDMHAYMSRMGITS